MRKKDMQDMRDVLRYVMTSNPDVQEKVLRLDALLEHLLEPKPKEAQK